ncbi:ankyrin repeat domain-containing protein [bacterium]|nr:ankyrin repeat domain-containing protein [bacterium]
MKHILITTIAAVVLVGCGPSVDIWEAAKNDNVEMLRANLNHGVNINKKTKRLEGDGYTALHHAANRGNINSINFLISHVADINSKDVFGTTPLHLAVMGGQYESCKKLITAGADINSAGGVRPYDTPLDDALKYDNKELIHFLRTKGAKTGPEVSIVIAASRGDEKMVNFHLGNGGNVNFKDDNGDTPLITSSMDGHHNVTKLLISNGADINAINNEKRTALHAAVIRRHLVVLNLLIQNSANLNSFDSANKTPLDYAAKKYSYDSNKVKKEKVELSNLLRKHGGKTGDELKGLE